MIQFHLLEPSILLPFLKPLSLSLTSHYEEHDDKDNNEETLSQKLASARFANFQLCHGRLEQRDEETKRCFVSRAV